MRNHIYRLRSANKATISFALHFSAKFLVACLGLSLLITHYPIAPVSAAIVRKLPFSASLKTANGTTVADGNYSVQFNIYTVATGGTATWTETQTIAVSGGVISANLGDVTPIPSSLTFNDTSYYLGVKVGTDAEATPRRLIGAVPISLNADAVDGASAGTSANEVLLLDSGGDINIAGDIITTGTLQGGTATVSTLNTASGNLTVAPAGGTTAFTGAITVSQTGANALALTGAPAASTTSSLLQLGSAISGGSSNGTFIGVNAASGFSGNFLDFQVANDIKFRLGSSNIQVGASIIPTTSGSFDLGSSSFHFGNAYIDNLVAGTVSTSGTSSTTFTINQNAVADGDSSVVFYRGGVLTSAQLLWRAGTGTNGIAVNSGAFSVNNPAWILSATPADADYGKLSIGTNAASFDGTSTGNFEGSASGTELAINATSGFAGNLVDAQVAGTSVFSVSSAGAAVFASTINGATLSGGTMSGGSLSATAVNGLSVASGTISSPTISGTVSGSGSPTITGFGTINGASLSGGTLSGGSLSASAVNGLSVASGTISVGTWNGTAIGAQYGGTGLNTSASTGVATVSSGTWSIASSLGATTGGTGQTSVTTGDLLYGSATNTWGKLAGVATGSILISGGVGTAPSWSSAPTLTTSLTVPTIATASGALTLQSANGTTKLLTSATNATLEIYGSGGTNKLSLTNDNTNSVITSSSGELQLQGAGTNQFILGDVGTAINLVFEESSTISGQGSNTVTIGQSGDTFNLGVTGVTYNVGALTATSGLTLQGQTSTSATVLTANGPTSLSGNLLDLQVNGSSKLSVSASGGVSATSVTATGQVLATTDGLATKVVAGVISDGSFTTSPSNGMVGIDSSNGRIYFRYGGAWHYVAQTAGFQIPNYETAGINVGDSVVGMIDGSTTDGGLHGVFRPLTESQPYKDLSSAISTLQNSLAILNTNANFTNVSISSGLRVATITSSSDITLTPAVNHSVTIALRGSGTFKVGSDANNITIDSNGNLKRNGTATTNNAVETFTSLLASNPTAVTTTPCTGLEFTTSTITQPDVPRTITVSHTGGNVSGAITLTGTLADGSTETSESLTINPNATAVSQKAYATITSIRIPSTCGNTSDLSFGTSSRIGLANSLHGQNGVYKIKKNATDIPLVPVDTTNSTVDMGALADGDSVTIWYRY